MIGKYCVVRTYSAGVHCGTLVSVFGTAVTLANATRLWAWDGAFTLNEVSQAGVNRGSSRISVVVPEILLTEGIEVIPCSDVAKETLCKPT